MDARKRKPRSGKRPASPALAQARNRREAVDGRLEEENAGYQTIFQLDRFQPVGGSGTLSFDGGYTERDLGGGA